MNTKGTLMKFAKCKHSSLTKWMRRKHTPGLIPYILEKCAVSPHVGALPPQLCMRLPVEERASAMYEFCRIIENFWDENYVSINCLMEDTVYDIPGAGMLFHTPCKIIARGVNVMGFSPWSGGFGLVCKVSFPEIGADYALKYFLPCAAFKSAVHGAKYEIPTAFAANHAEPRDNCTIYMASLVPGRRFMLSQWAGDQVDGTMRKNKNEIFATSDTETDHRNWGRGQRLDFGDTHKTEYGNASYRVRKLYRQIENAAKNSNFSVLDRLRKKIRTARDEKDFCNAMEMVAGTAFFADEWAVCDFVDQYMQRMR